MSTSKIAELSVYKPERVVSNKELEAMVNKSGDWLPAGVLEKLFGIRERRFATAAEQVSDLATKAARPIVERVGAENIDYLIFAAACSDMIEPATCNLVQYKLGLNCPAMDVKNACNSFVSGMYVASSLIQSGMCRRVLVVNGEKLSDAIRLDISDEAQLKRHLAAYSLGDAGAAALITASDDASGFQFQKFMTKGSFWELCTIKGGGSLFPHDPEKNYFEGQTVALKDVIAVEGSRFFLDALKEAGWKRSDIRHLFTHQVSMGTFKTITDAIQVPVQYCEQVFPHFGNTAAASIPLAMHARYARGELKKGDKVAILGLAAGVSLSIQLLVW